MKKILILGSTGFIGRNLYEHFLNKYKVEAPKREELNLLNGEAVYQFLEKGNFDVVINAVDLREANEKYLEDRLRIFLNLERCSRLYDKMINFGSGAEYARELPVLSIKEEEFNRKIPEDTYGFCLHQISEKILNSDNIYHFRLFGIFGKYELWQKRFISNAICKSIYQYPITIRQNVIFDYLYMDDLCKIVEWAIENKPEYKDYNAVSGKKYELKELADRIKIITNNTLPVLIAEEGLGKEYTASCDRLRLEMKTFEPENIEISISKLAEWYRQNINQIKRYPLLYQ